MLTVLIATAIAADPPAEAATADPPTQGLTMTIDAYGTPLVGHIVVDADAMGGLGLTYFSEQDPRKGPVVPLVHGLVIKGLPQGTRIVQDAIDTLMYFDGNADGYLDAKDPLFAHLGLFIDKNNDQAVSTGEVRKLGEIGVDAISRYGSVTMKERTR